jgi:hypothetical protein
MDLMASPPRKGLPTHAIDLHCPYVRGDNNEHVYIVGSPDPANAASQKEFAAILASIPGGPGLGFTADDILPHGTAWNTAPPEPRTSCGRWFSGRAQNRLAATFEIPYGAARGNPVVPQTARAFGRNLMSALLTTAW